MSLWSVKITFILLRCHRPIDNYHDFYLFFLVWKGSWQQRIQSWNFQTLSWIKNLVLLSRTLSVMKFIRFWYFYYRFYYKSNYQLLMLFFLIVLFEVHLWLIVYHDQEISDCIYCLHFGLNFYQYFFAHIFCKRQKSKTSKYLISRLNWIVHHFLNFTV